MQLNQTGQISAEARQRFKTLEGDASFKSDWLHTVMIHYAVDPKRLQSIVPFDLDLCDGRAYVSLIAFEMRRLRPTYLGSFGAALFSPIGNHPFLNIRTYVRDHNDAGIYFLIEYLPNLFSVPLGPPTFGLPYRWGRISYQNVPTVDGILRGRVRDGWNGAGFGYEACLPRRELSSSPNESLTHFVMERYTAFTNWHGLRRRFRIWHEPWLQVPCDIRITEDALLHHGSDWYKGAELCGANYSPGVSDVWMGRPRIVRRRTPQANRSTFGKVVMR